MLKNILENILILKKKDNFFFVPELFFSISKVKITVTLNSVFAREQKSNGNRIIFRQWTLHEIIENY